MPHIDYILNSLQGPTDQSMTSEYDALPENLYPGMQRQLIRKDETITYGLGSIS